MKTKFLVSIFLFSLLVAQDVVYPPPSTLVTIPTAGGLLKGSFTVDLRFQKNGGLTTGLSVGITDRFMFGLSYGASELIGENEPIFHPRPEVILKYRLRDETPSIPAIALGLDTQGFGAHQDSLSRYEVKAFGAYATFSKNWRTFLGNVGAHAGVSYNFTEKSDKDTDPNVFFGSDMEINPELSILIEYNAGFNENNKSLQTIAIDTGYLNAALRWTFVKHLHLEMDFNNLLINKGEIESFNRELKIIYIEYF